MLQQADNEIAALVEKARKLIPIVAERAAECEKLRRLPEATERDFRDAGFYRVLQPSRYGGFEMDYGVQTELAMEIGRGCASSGWNLGVIAAHSWMLGMFPAEAQDDVWESDPEATLSSSFLPLGKPVVETVDGGWRLSGRWVFSSGADYCQATILMGLLPREQGEGMEPVFFTVMRDDYEIEDTWHATGLAGTGSNDLILKDVFVPHHRMLRVMDTRGGPTPGSHVNDSHLYRLPLYAVFPFNLIGAAIGAARGAVETIVQGLAGRETVTGVDLARLQSVHNRIADASARVETAWSALQSIRHEFNFDSREGRIPDIQRRAYYRLLLGQAARMSVECMEIIYPLLGGRGLAVGNSVQRAWRDVHAVAQHIGLNWDIQAGLYGPTRLGLPCPDPKL